MGKGGKWAFSPETGSSSGYSPKFRLLSLTPCAPGHKFFPWVCSTPLLQKITPESFRGSLRDSYARFLSLDTFRATNLKLLRKQEMVLCGLGYGVLASMVLRSWLLAQATEPC